MKINQKGFTLIEILVVITIIGILTGITADIFIQIVRGSNKANVVTEIKQNGDNILNQLERVIRNAEEITAFGETDGAWDATAWTDASTVSAPYTWNCLKKYCAIIIKNQGATGGFTKIEIHAQKNDSSGVNHGDQKCNSAPFTTNDQDQTVSPYECNGNIRLVTDTSSTGVDILKNISDTVSAATIGQVISNTEKRSGVSVVPASDTTPLFSVKYNTASPTIVTTQFALTQAINASSRLDSRATVPFASTISLRVYNSE